MAIVGGVGEGRIDRLRLMRARIELLHAAAIDDVRIFRIGSEVFSLAPGGDLTEVREVDSVNHVRPARNAGSARVLLRSVDPVWESIVCTDVVELTGRLVDQRAPRVAAVQRHDRALIDAQDSALWMLGIDP